MGYSLWGRKRAGHHSGLTSNYRTTTAGVSMSVLLAQFIPPSPSCYVHTSVLCVCISLPALLTGSSVPLKTNHSFSRLSWNSTTQAFEGLYSAIRKKRFLNNTFQSHDVSSAVDYFPPISCLAPCFCKEGSENMSPFSSYLIICNSGQWRHQK